MKYLDLEKTKSSGITVGSIAYVYDGSYSLEIKDGGLKHTMIARRELDDCRIPWLVIATGCSVPSQDSSHPRRPNDTIIQHGGRIVFIREEFLRLTPQ